MCTNNLCNNNEYGRPRQFLRKQLGPQRLPFNSVAEGEIEHGYKNRSTTGINESIPGQSSNISSTSILFLQPPFPHQKQKESLSETRFPTPFSIINTQKNNNNVSIDTLYVDTSVKALDTQHIIPNNELPVTPREEASLDNIDEDDNALFEDIVLENEEEDYLNSTAPKHRVPRQAQGENQYIIHIFYIGVKHLAMCLKVLLAYFEVCACRVK